MCLPNFTKIGYFKANFLKSWYGAVSYLIFRENTHKWYIFKLPRLQLHYKLISVQIRPFAEMLDSFEIGKLILHETNCLCVMNLWSLLFEQFSCFLKSRNILKGFDYFLWLRKRVLLKGNIFFISSPKGYLFHKRSWKGVKFYMLEHICTVVSHKSHHRDSILLLHCLTI